MAITTSVDLVTGPFVLGDRRAVIFSWTPDASWLAAGEALARSVFGFSTRTDLVLFEQKGGYTFEYDDTNEKVLAYYADYSSATDGALIAVPDTTDISAIGAVKGLAIGV